MLKNHGILTGGATIDTAMFLMAFGTKACEYQQQAMASVGGDVSKLLLPSEEETRAYVERFKFVPPEFAAKQKDINYHELMFGAMRRRAEAEVGALPIFED